ncbi:MAG: hypothetical protein ABIP96_03900 [Patescibacteria group bacterium]
MCASHSFIANVVYTQPSFEELQLRFRAHYVDKGYKSVRFSPNQHSMDLSEVGRDIEFEYVYLNSETYSSTEAENVLVEMERRGLRPARYEELLAFGEAHPGEPLKFAIVALGSEVEALSVRHVACLWSAGGTRMLMLNKFNSFWCGFCRFLAVRK